ncbi:RNA polymerase sigma-54 factor [Rhodospirillum sp. A1_3_36]|uniref:RNA polymerase factor sigma-54 n=1 Tax=Rhodospirillum sp. A1_3_36 TaxID=3391666 RepID=UPI0039A61E60
MARALHQIQRTAPRLGQAMRRAISFLRMDNADLTGFLVGEAADNPCLDVRVPLPERDGGSAARSWARSGTGMGDLDLDGLAAPSGGLHAHVMAQVGLLFSPGRTREIAMAFVEGLEPSGWLSTGVAEVARAAGCTQTDAERVLARLRTMEPTGLFALSLADCLGLQLAERGELSGPMERLLANLPLLARGDGPALVRICGVPPREMARLVTLVRRLNPKPGALFDGGAEPIRPPDLVVDRDAAGEWTVSLDRGTAPDVRVSEVNGTKEQRAEAQGIIRALSRRTDLVLRVAAHAVAAQRDFLEGGPTLLRPLTTRDVALALGVHETTVGRIRSGLLVRVPERLVPMRAFFGRGAVKTTDGRAVAGEAIGALVTELIRAESPQAPLTDGDLVKALADKGILVSRETVGNWRRREGHGGARDRGPRGALATKIRRKE